ncbi:MAG: NFACT RNA binding domain-containing protein [Desulfurella sp.]|uniref:NFACT RNA binding domain-containing protein n=1 Tax=Desulfurella sp. TaxID=1962857 RepID=UPI003C9FEEE6
MNSFLFNYFATKIKKNILDQKITHVYGSDGVVVLNTQNGLSIFFKLDSPGALFFGMYQLPKTQNQFATNLQKKINKLKIVSADFRGIERVLILKLLDKRLDIEHYYFLVFEITGRNGNLILCDTNQKIIESYRYNTNRQILPNKIYKKPNQMLDITTDNINILKNALHVKNILGIDNFVKKFVGKENIDNFIEITKKSYEKLFQYEYQGKKFVYPFLFDFSKNVNIIDDEILFNQIFSKNSPKSSNNIKIIQSIDKKLKKYSEKIEKIENDIQKAKDAEKIKLFADTLLENINFIKLNGKEVYLKPINYTDEIAVPINPQKTIQENINFYYKLYKKYKNAEKILSLRLNQVKQEYSYLANMKEQMLNNQIDPKDANKFLKTKINQKIKLIENFPYERFNILGFDVYIGKNAKGNDLILKNASKEDIWMHPKNIPGPHLIIKNPKRLQELEKTLLEKCAKKIKEEIRSNNKIEIDYTFVKYVKKPKGFKKGRVTYANFKTVVVS